MTFSSGLVCLALAFTCTYAASLSYISQQKGWVELAPIARGPRQEHGVAFAGDDVYIIGGVPRVPANPTTVPSLDWADAYSTKDDTWRVIAPIPTPMNHANAVGVNGKIYVLGGMTGDNYWKAIPDCYEYDPKADVWTTLPSMPADQARGASALGVRGSNIYLGGGVILTNLTTTFQISVATVTTYNIDIQKWDTLPDLPEARDHVGGAVIDGTFYVVGGRVNGNYNVRNTTFALDLDRPDSGEARWVEKAPMPTARGGLATSYIDGVIYTFGGEGNPDLIPNGVYNATEAYNVATDTWARLQSMSLPRHGTNAVAIGSCNYSPGGGNVAGPGAVDWNGAFCVANANDPS
ncbi:hypothetical protein BGW36DRAFT_382470 [Talaromyces proteolyticus]|uniref:Galactose oxidase n=1 Tax=Talaromyces proteolyticus TaxID=1131652 RepID=A0AAD4KMG1_9EURO|nr:uncharacterized protein BGW36DRAFT_382470 [Talaromyces proteolyticus]KAH8695310.1 hypothetical protein BGW36DRAFT_382470 [Talaromyces proteolyticus]